ncbi:glucokinase [Verticillium alfalfae VaMs.102]|uniref:Phosphotransferase n=1 Tax=Verticillium alfalfae (strain VaMs.102 / ATCC MYA-4576 / FGSC 10136) TaxID=526221 RepID=C9SYA1_VERA1|nr:glucokinase [Verticillium alfalfae VaMs.102]EEY23766.1 glucokinase [Verticillium alfalfae VaMs.102]
MSTAKHHDGATQQPLDPTVRAEAIAQHFDVSSEILSRGTEHFVKQLGDGLLQDGTTLLQVPSYVTKLPNGLEKGVSLAIDLGGTNLRVCSVELHGDSTHTLTQSKTAIPADLMTSKTYKSLFDFIARHTEAFMQKHMPKQLASWRRITMDGKVTDELRRQHLHSLGFTFSFTFDQHAINKGTLMYWTKAFSIEDAIGRDPCAMLQESLDSLHLPLEVAALVNDTVGTLAARAYASPGHSETLLGAIFGTGTNGAYVERIQNIKKLHAQPEFSKADSAEFMALNTEWGGFDNELSVLPITIYDEALDGASVNPDDQHFEKRISGLYLGEILRRVVLIEMQSTTPIFKMTVPLTSSLHLPYSIDSSFLSALVRDQSPGLESAQEEIVKILDASQVSVKDAAALQIIAASIGRRAARLSAIAIAGIVVQSGRLNSRSEKAEIAKRPVARKSLLARLLSSFRRAHSSFVRCVRRWLVKSKDEPKATDEEASDSGYASSVGQDEPSQEEGIIDIGVDGSLFEFFPGFEAHIRIALKEIPAIGIEGEKLIRMGAAADGSGVGAALIAWASTKS